MHRTLRKSARRPKAADTLTPEKPTVASNELAALRQRLLESIVRRETERKTKPK